MNSGAVTNKTAINFWNTCCTWTYHMFVSINNLSLRDGMGRTKIYGKLTFSKMALTLSGTRCAQSGNCMWSVFSFPLATLLFNLNYSSIHIATSHCGLNLYIPGVWDYLSNCAHPSSPILCFRLCLFKQCIHFHTVFALLGKEFCMWPSRTSAIACLLSSLEWF